MPKYRITSPDGQKYDITVPEVASQEDIISFATDNFPKESKEKPSKSIFQQLFVEPAEAASRAAYKIGGAVTDVTGSPGAGYAANVATQAVPAVLGGEVAKAASPLFQKAAKSLMQSAAKPTLAQLRSGDAKTAIDTMLEEGINPTQSGVSQLKDKITDINSLISDRLAQSNEKVTLGNVGKSLMDTYNRFQGQVNPQTDLNALRSVWERFREHPLMIGKEEIPVQLAQQLKTGTYKQLAGKYGELGSAETEGQKALARGLKEEIGAAVPEVAGLNAQEAKLIKTLKVAERRALMDLNKNPMGLSLLAENPSAWAAFMADKSATFKALAARMLYSGSEQLPATAGRGMVALSEIGAGAGRE